MEAKALNNNNNNNDDDDNASKKMTTASQDPVTGSQTDLRIGMYQPHLRPNTKPIHLYVFIFLCLLHETQTAIKSKALMVASFKSVVAIIESMLAIFESVVAIF